MNERSEGDADGRGAGGGTLVVSPNWLGDAVMAMPALRRLARRALPEPAVWTAESVLATLLALAAALFVAGGTHNAFLYFKF